MIDQINFSTRIQSTVCFSKHLNIVLSESVNHEQSVSYLVWITINGHRLEKLTGNLSEAETKVDT